MSTDRKFQIAPAWEYFWMSFCYWGQNQPNLIRWNNSFKFIWDQYQDLSWFWISVKTNTKKCLDIGNDLRPIPRVLIMVMFETNTNTNTRMLNQMKMTEFQGSQKPMFNQRPISLYLENQTHLGILPSQV